MGTKTALAGGAALLMMAGTGTASGELPSDSTSSASSGQSADASMSDAGRAARMAHMRESLGLADDPVLVAEYLRDPSSGAVTADAESGGAPVTAEERAKVRRDNALGNASSVLEPVLSAGPARQLRAYEALAGSFALSQSEQRDLLEAYVNDGTPGLRRRMNETGALQRVNARTVAEKHALETLLGDAQADTATITDTFAGYYLDRQASKFVVLLTDVSPSATDALKQAYPYPADLEFRKVQNSLVDLQLRANYAALSREVMENSLGQQISNVFVDIHSNRVHLATPAQGLDEGRQVQTVRMIGGVNVAQFSNGWPVPEKRKFTIWDDRCNALKADPTLTSNFDCHRFLDVGHISAGLMVSTMDSKICDLSWGALDPNTGRKFQMSAGHCVGGSSGAASATFPGTDWYNGVLNNPGGILANAVWAGRTIYATDGGVKDVSLMQVQPYRIQDSLRLYRDRDPLADTSMVVNQFRTDGGYEGEIVCFSGHTNNQGSIPGDNCGTVRQTSWTPTQGGGSDGAYKATFTCADDFTAIGGESGGPVFDQSNFQINAVGVMNGPQFCSSVPWSAGLYYSRLGYALNGFSFS